MTILLACLAQLLHVALLVLAAPILAGMLAWAGGGFAGTPAAIIRRQRDDLVRLWRKRPAPTEPSAALLRAEPAISAAITLVVALLVPSFAFGMLLAPLGDLLMLTGLLTLTRLLGVLAELESGTARGGLVAARHTRLGTLALTAMMPAILALALTAGGLTLDQIGAARFDEVLISGATRGLAAVALAAIATADLSTPGLDDSRTGPDLALGRLTEALRLLIWFNLILALFLPIGLITPDSSPGAWLLAILSWIGRLVALTVLVVLPRALIGSVAERWLSGSLMLAIGLAMLAAILALTHASPV